MDGTIIAWTSATFNPWMGCAKVSPGCAHCYAETLTKNRMGLSLWGKNGRRQITSDLNWKKPVKWNREAQEAGERRRVFCASLCDVFEDHPTANKARPDLWELIAATPNLDWQLLTKRPENIANFLPVNWGGGWNNVWLGVSTEDQQRAEERLPYFDKLSAAVFFASYEPALGPIDFFKIVRGKKLIDRLDWCIYGGESGPGFRPHDIAWPRTARDQFDKVGKAFFYKQSPAYRTEMGIELDGEIYRKYPTPRVTKAVKPTAAETLFG